MTNFELAKKALEKFKDEDFDLNVTAYGGGACGDGWSGEVNLFLSKGQLAYLLSENTGYSIDDVEEEEVDLEQLIEDYAREAAWPDGDEEEGYSYGGECEQLENYLESWEYFLDNIYSGDIKEDELDSWLEYFDDNANYDNRIDDWHEWMKEE